jgi:hypothetical protein
MPRRESVLVKQASPSATSWNAILSVESVRPKAAGFIDGAEPAELPAKSEITGHYCR